MQIPTTTSSLPHLYPLPSVFCLPGFQGRQQLIDPFVALSQPGKVLLQRSVDENATTELTLGLPLQEMRLPEALLVAEISKYLSFGETFYLISTCKKFYSVRYMLPAWKRAGLFVHNLYYVRSVGATYLTGGFTALLVSQECQQQFQEWMATGDYAMVGWASYTLLCHLGNKELFHDDCSERDFGKKPNWSLHSVTRDRLFHLTCGFFAFGLGVYSARLRYWLKQMKTRPEILYRMNSKSRLDFIHKHVHQLCLLDHVLKHLLQGKEDDHSVGSIASFIGDKGELDIHLSRLSIGGVNWELLGRDRESRAANKFIACLLNVGQEPTAVRLLMLLDRRFVEGHFCTWQDVVQHCLLSGRCTALEKVLPYIVAEYGPGPALVLKWIADACKSQLDHSIDIAVRLLVLSAETTDSRWCHSYLECVMQETTEQRFTKRSYWPYAYFGIFSSHVDCMLLTACYRLHGRSNPLFGQRGIHFIWQALWLERSDLFGTMSAYVAALYGCSLIRTPDTACGVNLFAKAMNGMFPSSDAPLLAEEPDIRQHDVKRQKMC